MRTTTVLLALGLVLAACGGADEEAASGTTSTTVRETTIAPGGTTTMPEADADLPIIEPALADLARRLGVDPSELEVVVAEEVTWPDGSLGCPEPGKSYTQALVDGSRVLLRHDDRVYAYHAGEDGEPFLCPSEERDGGHDFVPPPGYTS